MNNSTCKNCAHYRQHYIIDEQSCTTVDCGHCIYPRIKHRQPRHPACGHYVCRTIPPALPSRERVVHYLTTELPQYILSLDLPPELPAPDE